MKVQIKSEPLDIAVFGMPLKVFRIGKTPGIKYRSNSAQSPENMKSIHSHFTYEIFFVTDGTLELVTEDATGTYERKVLIIPPKIRHYSCPSGEGSYCLLFSFEDVKKAGKWQVSLESRLKQGICELPLSEDVAFYIRKIAEKCSQSDLAVEKEEALLASLLFYEIFRLLLPKEQIRQELDKGSAKHIYEIERFINSNMDKRISQEDVAEHISLSTRQVSRIIRKEYDCTLAELITDKKLTSAEILIRKTDMPIGAIAAQANLGSANYFFALFKNKYGVSPLQYRKKLQEDVALTERG